MTGLRALLIALIAISVAILPAVAEVIVLPSPDQVMMADQGAGDASCAAICC